MGVPKGIVSQKKSRVSTEAILISSVMDTKQQRDVVTLGIPNAFIETPIPEGEDKVIMRIIGPLVDFVLEMSSEKYQNYVNTENGVKAIEMLKASYGMMVSTLLF